MISTFPIKLHELGEFDEALKKIIRQYSELAVPNVSPFIIHMLGVPGTGKSTFANLLYAKMSDMNTVFLGFDRVMEQIPGYTALKEENIEQAFEKYELPARQAGYLILSNLISASANILFDHGGSVSEHIDILGYAKSQFQYRVYVVKVEADLDTAKKRILARAKETGRHTPLSYVDERDEAIRSLFPRYAAISDAYYILNNDHEDNIEYLSAGVEYILDDIRGRKEHS